MAEENINQEKNYFLVEIRQYELMSRKHKKVCTTLNYLKSFRIFASTITGCVSIFAFFFFDWSSYRNYKFCNRIKSIIKSINKKKKKQDQIVFLAKSN